MLVGMVLGGLRIELDEQRKNHRIQVEFEENLSTHVVLEKHVLVNGSTSSCILPQGETLDRISTISHPNFVFFADQFCQKGSLGSQNLFIGGYGLFVLA
ncbi:hypothetical protein SAY87_024728 [Trapa incisa]|uniref:Homing endonuclease LAGLIDADG domain-containing protein n=1 Tax=Trapa incisa TaxID=236973 RepID=A0AAN7G9X3_9MYRT|nr:hypothetical protein SAY87_024728 [Trapa incisa]